MHYFVQSFVLALLVQCYSELLLIRDQDDVYCMESNYSNQALTWIPTIEENKQLTYEEEVRWMPANKNLQSLRHLNCDLMRDGGCPLVSKIKGSWIIMDNASDDYGFITDHRWHSLPVYSTSGNADERKAVPVTPTEKGLIFLFILANDNAFLTVLDGIQGFVIKLDAFVRSAKRASLSNCNRASCSSDEINSTMGAKLNDGQNWTNIKIVVQRKNENHLFISIDEDILWKVPSSFQNRNFKMNKVTSMFISTANQQMGFWKFHHYKVLRPLQSGTPLQLDFKTKDNSELCLSILYHTRGLQAEETTAATLTIIEAQQLHATFVSNLKGGRDWQEFRQSFYLEKNTNYQFILTPSQLYPSFAIGEIRVCLEKEYLVTKMENQEENDTVCSTLNGNSKISLRNLRQDGHASDECPKGRFGKNCDIECSNLVHGSCKGLQVCNMEACSCLPGYDGESCENESNVTACNCTDKPSDSIIFQITSGSLGLALFIVFLILIVYMIVKKTRKTPAVEEVVYAEIDLTKAVPIPAPRVPSRIRYSLGRVDLQGPVHYDEVGDPQPLEPWIRNLSRRNAVNC